MEESPAPPPLDEVAILHAARTDLRHFAPIYERYAKRVYAYCLRRVGDPHEADDLTSTIFTRALTGLVSYRGGGVAAWLFTIARHTVINHHKQCGRHPAADLSAAEVLPDPAPPPDQVVIETLESAAIRALVAQLPDEQQELIWLKVSGGLTAEEIGTVIGKRPGTVRTALSRIISTLRDRYRDTLGVEERNE